MHLERIVSSLSLYDTCHLYILLLHSYNLLNFFRKPFLSVYDPGIDKIGRAASALQYPERCEILKQRPSADDFFQYVSRNRPFVLRGEGKHWGAFEKWNKSYLKEKIGETMVRRLNLLS